jgi:uncharacterized protein YciI
MKHFLLFYEVGPEFIQQREKFRTRHLELAWQTASRGELLLAGALAPPTDRAVLLFKGESAAVAENFAKQDPYVTQGLVKSWSVRQWNTVVAEDAATPLKPGAPR